MIKTMKKYQVAGFSLVELMVVVAIIGVLASVAIPNFDRFQRRAKAAEGKTMLSGFFNNNKAFQAEWEGYSSDLSVIGFSADGSIRTGGASGADFVPPLYTAQATASMRGMLVTVAALCGSAFAPGCTPHPQDAPPAAMAGAITATTFTFNAATNVGSGTAEEWSINQLKAVMQVQDGINI